MSAVGHCADNAPAEGFFGMIKRGRIHRKRYVTRNDAGSDVFDYIERFRNPRMQRSFHVRDQAFTPLIQQIAKTGENPHIINRIRIHVLEATNVVPVLIWIGAGGAYTFRRLSRSSVWRSAY